MGTTRKKTARAGALRKTGRPALGPASNSGMEAGTNGLSQVISGFIVGTNPELIPFHFGIQMLIHGILSGFGSVARNAAANNGGWKGALGRLFSWLPFTK